MRGAAASGSIRRHGRATPTVLEIDLAAIAISLAGPRRPQDLLAPATGAAGAAPPVPRPTTPAASLPRCPVAIAAITSCTNTSDPRLLIAAGLVARKARALGLQAAGLGEDLAGAGLAGGRTLSRAVPGCSTISRRSASASSAMAAPPASAIPGRCCRRWMPPCAPTRSSAVAVLSGNRNFPGRVHRQIDAGFLASPPLVVAYRAGRRCGSRHPAASRWHRRRRQTGVRSPTSGPRAPRSTPRSALALDPADFSAAFAEAAASRPGRRSTRRSLAALPLGSGFDLSAPAALRRGRYEASRLGLSPRHPLLVLGDDITTDHISPAGRSRRDERGRTMADRARRGSAAI